MDGKSASVLAHWSIAPCEEPTGLAIDTSSERLFSVCANQRMMVIDAASGHPLAEVPIGGHPDTAAFDPALNLVFSSNGADGTLTVVHEDDADHYSVAQNVQTLEGAKTMALDARDTACISCRRSSALLTRRQRTIRIRVRRSFLARSKCSSRNVSKRGP